MRVAIITESFAPDVNGVANSVLRIAEHLVARGHSPLVIAPEPAAKKYPSREKYPVMRLPSLPMPGYRNVRLALPSKQIKAALQEYRPDVVHLASPFVLGAWGGKAAADLGIPIVAVYQTDVPGYAAAYGLRPATRAAWRWVATVHKRASFTLAPSSASLRQLKEHGVQDIRRWGRGVDTTLFHPRHRSAKLRSELAPNGEVIVGYVGRLAYEKSVHLLSEVAKTNRVVIVGDGPTRRKVAKALPGATFLGSRSGADLATVYASLDIFVHTGPHETFCQTIQEASASGLPVIAPASGGPLDLVRPGVTGLLVPPDDPDAIADAVALLALDPELRQRYGRAARRMVADRTWEAVVDELLDHYRAAAASRPEPVATQVELVA
ncbi:MAG TPA: glycosyltransferase family 1 protein [Candidatus Limnocylindrales bacterium]|nr:glycosyltransferase family 1 protein [Candidatus Limnocylindrales bacterium]